MMSHMSGWRAHVPLLLLLALYGVTAVWLCFRLPAFSGPNEALHYAYVAHLRQTGRLPDPRPVSAMNELHQPPLYYAVAALAGLPFEPPPSLDGLQSNPYYLGTPAGNRNPFLHISPQSVPALYAGRLSSVLFGLLALVAIYGAATTSANRTAGLVAAAIVAFQPMFLYLSASLGNDIAVTAMTSVLLAYTYHAATRSPSPRRFFVWGVLFALALLAKASAMVLIALLPAAGLLVWRATSSWRHIVRCALAALLGFAPLYGLWLAANAQRQMDWLAVSASVPIDRILSAGPSALLTIAPRLPVLWRSFWLDWSAGEIGYAPGAVYAIWVVWLLAGLLGWARRRTWPAAAHAILLLNLLVCVPACLLFLLVKGLMVQEAGFLTPEGRWLLPISAQPGLAGRRRLGAARCACRA